MRMFSLITNDLRLCMGLVHNSTACVRLVQVSADQQCKIAKADITEVNVNKQLNLELICTDIMRLPARLLAGLMVSSSI